MLIVLGSRNPKKLEEIVEILGDFQAEGLEFADLTRFPQAPEVVEDGSTFEANARKKASELAVRFSIGAALAMTRSPDCAEPMNRNTRA